uniref:G-protein coupled receptors family 1 profile domain-containing protein n=1 Tax=Globodera rostochiensis TaxID=31243 RepID=A0A914HDR5_GLORO
MESDAFDSMPTPLNFSVTFMVRSAEALEALEAEDGNVMNRPLVKGFFLLAYILVFVSCVVGNSVVLICISINRSMRTVTNFFLANLAIADLLVGIFCVCQNAAHFVVFAHGTWPFGRALCHAYVYILHMIPNSSAGILVLLSVERFIAVLRPMLVHQLLTKTVLCLCTALVWSLSATMNIPYLIAVQYIEMHNAHHPNQNYGICTRRFLLWSDINILQLVSTVNLMVWYVLPLTLLFTIYASIGLVLIRTTDDDSVARTSQLARASANTNASFGFGQKKNSLLNGSDLGRRHSSRDSPPQKLSLVSARKASQLSQQKLSQLNSLGTDSGGGHVRRLPKIELVDSRRRVIRLCAVIVFAFAVLSLPRYIYFTWSVWREVNAPRCLNCLSALVQPTTFLLMFFASGINPILYAFLSQRFRSAIWDTFSFKKRKEQRKTEMIMLLRNHRLSEQIDRDALGAPLSASIGGAGISVGRTMSSNSYGNVGRNTYRETNKQKRRSISQKQRQTMAAMAGRTADGGGGGFGREESILETMVAD